MTHAARGPTHKIIWTIADQHEAMYKHNLFVRSHRVRLAGWSTHWRAEIRDNTTGRPVRLQYIAWRVLQCEPFYERLHAFWLQQHRHGWSGCWEDNCGSIQAMRNRLRAAATEARVNRPQRKLKNSALALLRLKQ